MRPVWASAPAHSGLAGCRRRGAEKGPAGRAHGHGPVAAALLRLLHRQRLPQRLAAGRGRGGLRPREGRRHLWLEGKARTAGSEVPGAGRTGARAAALRPERRGLRYRPPGARARSRQGARGRPTSGFVLLMRSPRTGGRPQGWAAGRRLCAPLCSRAALPGLGPPSCADRGTRRADFFSRTSTHSGAKAQGDQGGVRGRRGRLHLLGVALFPPGWGRHPPLIPAGAPDLLRNFVSPFGFPLTNSLKGVSSSRSTSHFEVRMFFTA